MEKVYADVLLINADYTPLCIMDWKKAIKLICKGKVEVVKYTEKFIENAEKTIKMFIPAVIRLLKHIRMLYGKKVPFNKHNLLIRDHHTCAYCGIKLGKHNASIDHILPISLGGKSTFDNAVASCIPCNNKKDNRTCAEARMYPKVKAYTPTVFEFILMHIKAVGMEGMLKDLGIM